MIVRTRTGELELRAFALTDMVRWGYDGLRNVTSQVGEKEFRGVPALSRAARIKAEAIAQLNLYCWTGEGTLRERADTAWQAKLFARPPSMTGQQTLFAFWETVGESLAWRGNAYIWKNVDQGRITEWFALHPDQVAVERNGTYTVTVGAGYIDPVGRGAAKYERLTTATILHIRGHGNGGQLLAPSPIQVFKQRLSGPVGRQKHEARMWRRGTALQVAIQFPAGVNKETADTWRNSWRSNYEGTEGETTAVIGGGAEIKPIGMTMADAQFVAMAHLTIEDSALIMGMPADMLGIPLQARPPDMEAIRQGWLADGLGPDLGRIEAALDADETLAFEPGTSSPYPGFNTAGFVRGDIATEAAIVVTDVQAGILTPNEGRALRGYPPIKGGDTLQLTPVGGAPNPGGPKPLVDPDDADVDGDEP